MTQRLSNLCREHESTDVSCFTCQREMQRRSEIRRMLLRVARIRREEQREQKVTTIWHDDAYGHSVETAPVPQTIFNRPGARCLCESDPISLAHYHAKQRYENAASVKTGEYEPGEWHEMLLDVEIPDWSFEALDYVYDVRRRCKAKLHFTRVTADEWLMPDAQTTTDPTFAVANAEEFEHAEFIRHRSHDGLPWHDGYDDDSPYIPNPSFWLSDAGWDREYGLPRTVTMPVLVPGEFKSDSMQQVYLVTIEHNEGCESITIRSDDPKLDWWCSLPDAVVVDETPLTEEVTQMGSVHWEYRRRSQGRQPWMPKATYKFVMDGERRRQRQQLQRTRIASLVRALGQDVKKPEIVAWVKSAGYEAALAALEARAAREGVQV